MPRWPGLGGRTAPRLHRPERSRTRVVDWRASHAGPALETPRWREARPPGRRPGGRGEPHQRRADPLRAPHGHGGPSAPRCALDGRRPRGAGGVDRARALSPGSGSGWPRSRGWRSPHGLPVAGVPTLDALAAKLPFAELPVFPLLDARKGEVYFSRYRWTGHHGAALGLPGAAAGGRRWPASMPAVMVSATRRRRAARTRGGGRGRRVAPPAQRLPSPAVIAQIGHGILAAGAGVRRGGPEPCSSRHRRRS